MKIAFICHDSGLSGAPRVGFQIAELLSSHFEIHFFAKRGGVLFQEYTRKNCFASLISTDTNHEFDGWTYESSLKNAIDHLTSLMPDIVYVNSMASSEWCVAARQLGLKVVLHLHEMRSELTALQLIGLFRTDICRQLDLVISVSHDASKDLLDMCDAEPDKLVMLPPGVIADRIWELSALDQEVTPLNYFGEKFDHSVPTIAMCGTASHRKGADIFLNLSRALPQFSFLWIGPWSKEEAPLNVAYADYLSQPPRNLFITNSVANPYPFFTKADCFVLTSREDPNPIVVLEAVLLSRSCVSFSETGGSKDVLIEFGILLHGKVSERRLETIFTKEALLSAPVARRRSSMNRFLATYDLRSIASKIRNEMLLLLRS